MGTDYSKVHRLIRLLTLMQSGEAGNATELARTLGVAKRTIYRDLKIVWWVLGTARTPRRGGQPGWPIASRNW